MYKASFEKQHEGLRGENTSSDRKHKSIWVCPDFFFFWNWGNSRGGPHCKTCIEKKERKLYKRLKTKQQSLASLRRVLELGKRVYSLQEVKRWVSLQHTFYEHGVWLL
jgi:hypothetical protein